MDQKNLKTSTKQRVIIAIIAILLLGSTIAAYAGIIVSGNKSNSGSAEQEAYTKAMTAMNEYGASISGQYFDTFNGFRSEVKPYNAETANGEGVQKQDLLQGEGRELATGDTDYFAYYIGFCPDGTVFDSSFDNFENPTSLKAPIYAGQGLIEGWNEGVVGMKIGGARVIQMPGELAYGESREICGGKNSPLKFVVMAVVDQKLTELESKVEESYAKLVQAYYAQQQKAQGTQQSGQSNQSSQSSQTTQGTQTDQSGQTTQTTQVNQ